MAVARSHVHSSKDHRRLLGALGIICCTATLELYGGIVTHSLTLVADFGHILSDVGALVLALVAVRVAGRPHTPQWTFGFHRAEVLAAALNGLVLLVIAVGITVAAVTRLRQPPSEVRAIGLMAIAAVGLFANGAAALLLASGVSANMRAVRLHVLFDLAGSALAIVAGAVIALTGWTRVDPLLSLVIVVLLVLGASQLLRAAAVVLMDAVPRDIDLNEVERALRTLPHVRAVHDIHCWQIATEVVAFAAHIEVRTGHDPQHTIEHATTLLRERFGITHVTLQPEVTRLHQPGTPVAPVEPR